jgi:hypothetical protein
MKPKRKFYVVGSEPPASIFDDLDALRRRQKAVRLPREATARPQRRAHLKETFARIPHDRAYQLACHRIKCCGLVRADRTGSIDLKSTWQEPSSANEPQA